MDYLIRIGKYGFYNILYGFFNTPSISVSFLVASVILTPLCYAQPTTISRNASDHDSNVQTNFTVGNSTEADYYPEADVRIHNLVFLKHIKYLNIINDYKDHVLIIDSIYLSIGT